MKGSVQKWPLIAIAAPAFVATWSGWVGLGGMAGFGVVNLLPGIWDEFEINSAITLPLGIEAYAAYAIGVWLYRKNLSARTRKFAMYSSLSALGLGVMGQISYHVLDVMGLMKAPMPIVVGVACVPIIVVGMTATLLHLIRSDTEQTVPLSLEPVRDQTDLVATVPVRSAVSTRYANLKPTAKAVRHTGTESGTNKNVPVCTDADIVKYIEDHHNRTGTMPSLNSVRSALPVGTGRVRKMLETVRVERNGTV